MKFNEYEYEHLDLEKIKENFLELIESFEKAENVEVQIEALHQIPALREAKIYRPGYAIEYDYFDPIQLTHSLESKVISGLFFAGQVNGTTGYEEAGGQGLVAGINAAIHCNNGTPFIMHRDESYIGVLIDDLVTKGVDEPYRMFTSRAEYRILLRQDDADARLTERAYHLGIAKRERYDYWQEKRENIQKILSFSEKTSLKAKDINSALERIGTTPIQRSAKIIDLIARPQVSLNAIGSIVPELNDILNAPKNRKEEIIEATEIQIKYRGYVERERIIAEKMHRLENIKIKDRFNYMEMNQLATEARQKLQNVNPETLAQASRIPGVSPSDINVLLVLLGR